MFINLGCSKYHFPQNDIFSLLRLKNRSQKIEKEIQLKNYEKRLLFKVKTLLLFLMVILFYKLFACNSFFSVNFDKINST